MDIETYIKNHNLLHEPIYTRYVEIFHGFQNIMHYKYGLNFVEIYSTKMFMKRVKLNNKSYYIIDYHFWNLFEHYLVAFYLCTHRYPITITPDYLIHIRRMIHNLIILTQASLQDDIPSLALSFAQEYENIGATFGKYDKIVTTKAAESSLIDNVVQFSYMAGIIHEMAHERLNILSSDNNGYQAFISFLIETLKYDPKSDVLRKAQLEVRTIFETHDFNGLAELFCDFVASLEIIDIIKKVLNNIDIEKEDKFHIHLIVDVITTPIFFQAFLVQNQMHWRYEYYMLNHMNKEGEKQYERIKRYYSEIMSRGTFLYYIIVNILVLRDNVSEESLLLKRTEEFDDISFKLFEKDYSESIIKRAVDNQKKYSDFKSRQIRNEILHWK